MRRLRLNSGIECCQLLVIYVMDEVLLRADLSTYLPQKDRNCHKGNGRDQYRAEYLEIESRLTLCVGPFQPEWHSPERRRGLGGSLLPAHASEHVIF